MNSPMIYLKDIFQCVCVHVRMSDMAGPGFKLLLENVCVFRCHDSDILPG